MSKRSVLLCAVLGSATFAGSQSGASKLNLQIIVVPSQAKAEQILEQVRHGADFSQLAKDQSTDSTAKDGGDMGLVDPSELRAELRDALRGVAPGQTTSVFRVPDGFAILKVGPIATATAKPSGSSQSATIALASYGSVRPSMNLGGMLEAELGFQNLPKADGWGHDLRAACEYRKASLELNIQQLSRFVDPSNREQQSQLSALDMAQMQFSLSQLFAYENKLGEAAAHTQQAYDLALAQYPQLAPQLQEALATTYLHKAEGDVELYQKPGDRCLLPHNGPGQPEAETDVRRAIQLYTEYLDREPGNLEVRWLLNLSYMRLGKYPDGVPARYLVPASAFESKEQVGRFVDIAQQVGLDNFSMAGGLIVDDFDNDGFLDVLTSSFDMCGHMHFFHNNGDGTFSDRTEQAGLFDQLGGLNALQADYNNDGCMDILVVRGGWEWPMRMSLLKNDCSGKFTDVTRASGLESTLAATQTAVWADIDNDGLLDLFVGNERGPALLFRNKGDGTFEEIGHRAGIDRSTFAKAVVAADYDNDGYVDFYVSNLYADNLLYHNNHDGTFTEVAADAGVQKPLASFASWFFDYDNDGWPDLFVTSYYMSTEESVRSRLGLPVNAETLKLYRNLGNGKFQDVTAQVGLDKVFMPMGGNFGDFDNDGLLDIYMGGGSPSFIALVPYVLFKNQHGTSFVDVTASAGVGELHKGHGVAFADLRNNGQNDIITVVGGAMPSDAHAMRLFASPGTDNNWINVHLVGAKSNRAAIGAGIEVIVENQGKRRKIYRTVGSGGSFGASPLRQLIGLGKSSKILEMNVAWPATKTQQHFANIAVNQFIEINESANTYKKVNARTFQYPAVKK